MNRGFLNGPYCPIYGCGAILNILFLGAIENTVLLFLAAALLTGALEYLTSWGMEKLFHARWWDYSDKKFNIHGRVYLTGAAVFGSFSVLLMKIVHPFVTGITTALPPYVLSAAAMMLLAILLADTIFTVTKFSEFNSLLRNVSVAADDARESVKMLRVLAGASFRSRFRKFNSQIYRMLSSFPKLTSTKYSESLRFLRELIFRHNINDKLR